MARGWLWRLTPLACGIIALFWPLYYLHHSPGGDWSYFDSLSLVVRSSVHSYGRFPLHEPWVMGGADLLANPQTRIFSPLGILDLIARPHVANVLSLLVHAVLGAWGMARFLVWLGNDCVVAALGALMWVGGSWFMLHYSEGHIIYGGMQLLPWVVMWLMQLHRPGALTKLTALLAFFLLDGGVYAFIFSIYAAIAMAAVGLVPVSGVIESLRTRRSLLPLLFIAFVGVTAPKTVPVVDSLGTRVLAVEHSHVSGKLTLMAFFDTDQWYPRRASPTQWRFHEVGCYLGFATLLLIGAALTRRGFAREQWRWLAFGFIFLWIGTNALSPVNPWDLIIHTPLLRNAHVQTRVFIWLYFAWIVLACAALRALPVRLAEARVMFAVAVLEIVLVSQAQWYRGMHMEGGAERYQATARDIETRTWRHTVMWAMKPEHYSLSGLGALDTYEPAQQSRTIRYRGGPGYYGEIRVVGGDGTAELTEVSPSLIAFHYDGSTPATVHINQNSLAGWRVVSGDAEPVGDDPSLEVRIDAPGDVVMRYRPWYWPDIVGAWACGILLFVGIAFHLRQKAVT